VKETSRLPPTERKTHFPRLPFRLMLPQTDSDADADADADADGKKIKGTFVK
jgi:hypothetical protein